jgi:hypothetical protein
MREQRVGPTVAETPSASYSIIVRCQIENRPASAPQLAERSKTLTTR